MGIIYKPPFFLKRGHGEDYWYQGLAQPTLGNNLCIHTLIWCEYPRFGRPKDYFEVQVQILSRVRDMSTFILSYLFLFEISIRCLTILSMRSGGTLSPIVSRIKPSGTILPSISNEYG